MNQVIDWDTIKWPVNIVQTPSASQGRWVMQDAQGRQVAVLYDVSVATALNFAQSLNQINRTMMGSLEDINIETVEWPSYMGQYPRYGAQWTEAEKEQLYVWWQKGVPMKQICQALGRDTNGVSAKLNDRYGDRSMEFFGSANKRRKLKELTAQLTKTLAEMAKIAAS